MNCASLLAAIDDTRLTTVERVVFGNIVKGYQTRAEIAKATGCAESSVPRAVRKLEALGYLKRHFNDGKANTYEVLPQPETGIQQDTGIATSRTKKSRGIPTRTGVNPPADTGEGRQADTGSAVIEDAEFVDNAASPCIGTGARAETLNLNTSCSEVPPETPEQLNTPTRTPARGGGSLVQRVCDLVGSPWLDPCKSSLLTTRPGRLARWAAQMDVESELIPILKAKIACNGTEPIVSWNYFEFAVNDFLKDKQQQAQEVANDHAASAPRHAAGATTVRRKYDPVFDAIYREEPVAPPIDYGRVDFSSGK